MCFIGHGAFGIITKPGWVPFFHALGISEPVSYRLMPIIGANDIFMATFVLLSPCRIALAWMTVWAVFTSYLRPLAEQGYWELIERAGNYGIPLAFLVMSGWSAPGGSGSSRSCRVHPWRRIRRGWNRSR